MADRVAVTRRIAAPASAVFAVVSRPSGHVRIDGSGMLVAAPDDTPLGAVGDTFDIDMDRRPLGDIPEMGEYTVQNTVTAIVPDRLVEWGVGAQGSPPFGHVYGWQIEAISDSECEVTNYVDWTNIPDDVRERSEGRWPVVPVEMLQRSLDNLDAEVAGKD